jgi:hypothetical protein
MQVRNYALALAVNRLERDLVFPLLIWSLTSILAALTVIFVL